MIRKPKYEEKQNIESRISYLEEALRKQKIVSLYIEPSAFCNYACKNCAFHFGQRRNKKPGLMSKEIFERIHFQIQNLTSLPDTIHLYLHGEPLLNPRLEDMAQKLRNLCKTTKLVTNGVFLTDERLRDLIAARVRSITISLDTVSRDSYVAFKGSEQFDRVMRNVHDAVRMALNISHVELIIKGIESKEESLNAKQLIEYFLQKYPEIERSNNVHIEIRKEFEWPSFDNLPLYHDMCELPFYQLAIHWDGKVSACCNDIEYGGIIGDITKTSLQEIIRGETLSEIRKDMIDKNFDSLDTCLRCSFRTVVTDFGGKTDQIRRLL